MNPFFISEIGVNHLGFVSKAFRMVKQSKEAGATAVKFQKYDPIRVLGSDSPYLNDAHQLTYKELEKLSEYSHSLGLKFSVSVFDVRDVTWASSISDFMKVASRMNRNLEFLAKIDSTKLPVIMSIQPDVTLRKTYRDRWYFMWCMTNYPTPVEYLLKNTRSYSYKYGLSSHCPSILPTIAAYEAGARIFENHVKEFETDEGCDMSSSITLDEYAQMVDTIESLDHSTIR